MKKIISISAVLLFTLSLGFWGCKDAAEDNFPTDGLEAIFSYTLDGNTVTFHNQSKVATSFTWDFGDGQTSTDKDPVHAYPQGKGKYIVLLTATAPDGRVVEGSTVLLIDKAPTVKLDDNSLADWNSVTRIITNTDPNNAVISGKIDYDATWVYLYVEQNNTLADNTIQAIYLDKDGTIDTGFYPWFHTGTGADFEMEGQLTKPEADRWFDIYKFIGADDHTGWNWEAAGLSDFFKMGYYEESNGILRWEIGLRRDKLGIDASPSIVLGVNILSDQWSDIGFLPDSGSDAFRLNME